MLQKEDIFSLETISTHHVTSNKKKYINVSAVWTVFRFQDAQVEKFYNIV